MVKLGDGVEQVIDESMPYCFERLGDTSALRKHGCLTLAQCALLVTAMNASDAEGDVSEMAAHWLQLALLDVAKGELVCKHPNTLLPASQYLRMAQSGMFGLDGAALPVPHAGWLVSLDEAERWLRSKETAVSFDGIRADLDVMRREGLTDWPTSSNTAPAGETPAPASEAGAMSPAPLSRTRAQETAILFALWAAGHDPLAIPRWTPGKPGVKADIRRRLLTEQKNIFSSQKVFDMAWQRLRGDDLIREEQ